MQIVIDIPEEDYERFKKYQDREHVDGMISVNVIADGTLLPKGHGDLVDRNDLLAESYVIDDYAGNEINIVDRMTVEMVDAIIEADKEVNNEPDNRTD